MDAHEMDQLRADCLRFFDRAPEPPVYLRQDDPARQRANELLTEGHPLLARAATAPALAAAVKAHLAALEHTAQGRLGDAEGAWWEARALEDAAMREQRLWQRSDEAARPVYDPATGTSRYDPLPDPTVTVKLACPNTACQRVEPYAFSPRVPTHELLCPKCKTPFVAYFAQVRHVNVAQQNRRAHYRFRLEEAGGGMSRVEFEEPTGAELRVARGDFVAFLYAMDRELRAVVDLSSTKVLWVTRAGPCFVATAAFGEGAPELAAFRAYRDLLLMRSAAGAWAVRAYYRFGPALAASLRSWPLARSGVRRLLSRVHAALVRRGYS